MSITARLAGATTDGGAPAGRAVRCSSIWGMSVLGLILSGGFGPLVEEDLLLCLESECE